MRAVDATADPRNERIQRRAEFVFERKAIGMNQNIGYLRNGDALR